MLGVPVNVNRQPKDTQMETHGGMAGSWQCDRSQWLNPLSLGVECQVVGPHRGPGSLKDDIPARVPAIHGLKPLKQ